MNAHSNLASNLLSKSNNMYFLRSTNYSINIKHFKITKTQSSQHPII